MANKLFLISATLAFFFLLANASIYRTVVEFDEDDVTNPGRGQQQRCRREFQQEQQLRACQQWIRRQAMQPGGGPREDEDELDFEINPYGGGGSQQRHPVLQQCCRELRQEDPQCVCPTLRQAAQAVRMQGQQQQQHGPMQVRRIFQTAKYLPNVCDIPQVSVCPFQSTPYY